MHKRDDSLPNGMSDMGPIDDLKENHPNLLNAAGLPANPSLSNDRSSNVVEPPVVWIEDEELSALKGELYWYPKLDTPLAVEYGAPRRAKEFYKGEREMFINVFAMHISNYLFGVDCVTVVDGPKHTSFAPNPEFAKLPIYTPRPD